MQIVLSELGFELSAELQPRETPPWQEWPNRMALHTVGSVQLLNCTRGQATTISVLQDFAAKHENLILLLQEPWCDRHGNPPSLPGFDIFTPSSTKPKCVTHTTATGFNWHHSLYRPGLFLGNHDHYTTQPKNIHPLQLLLPRTGRATGYNASNPQATKRLPTYGRPQHTPPMVAGTPSTVCPYLPCKLYDCKLA